jgi:hypothetical protein
MVAILLILIIVLLFAVYRSLGLVAALRYLRWNDRRHCSLGSHGAAK